MTPRVCSAESLTGCASCSAASWAAARLVGVEGGVSSLDFGSAYTAESCAGYEASADGSSSLGRCEDETGASSRTHSSFAQHEPASQAGRSQSRSTACASCGSYGRNVKAHLASFCPNSSGHACRRSPFRQTNASRLAPHSLHALFHSSDLSRRWSALKTAMISSSSGASRGWCGLVQPLQSATTACISRGAASTPAPPAARSAARAQRLRASSSVADSEAETRHDARLLHRASSPVVSTQAGIDSRFVAG